MRKQNKNPKEPANLQAALSTQITCTLSLRELMRAQPKIWEGITEDMVAQGLLNKGKFDQIELAKAIVETHIEFSKVSGIQGKEKGNTTLLITYKGVESTTILDSKAGIIIATKTIWGKWGKPIVTHTYEIYSWLTAVWKIP